MNGGKPASDFSMAIMGRLQSVSAEEAAAFYLGWYGVISLNTPEMRPSGFDVNKLSSKAGFPKCEDSSELNCLEGLVDRARGN